MWGKKSGVAFEKILPYHRCTQADLAEFAPPTPEAVGMLESMNRSQTRGIFCLDWTKLGDIVEIWSVEDDENYQRFDFAILPCNYVHWEFGDVGDSVAAGCIADLEKQQNYLGNMKAIIYMSEQVFN